MLWSSQKNVPATNNGIALIRDMIIIMKVVFTISLGDSNGTTIGTTIITITSFPNNIVNGLMINILS